MADNEPGQLVKQRREEYSNGLQLCIYMYTRILRTHVRIIVHCGNDRVPRYTGEKSDNPTFV